MRKYSGRNNKEQFAAAKIHWIATDLFKKEKARSRAKN
jgi:hypothetical protein